MPIPQSIIDEIEEKTDIVELISSYFPLKRNGNNFKALCPFHNEKTPSFIISAKKQIFHCFGCGAGGGVIQFMMQYEHVNFPEAIEILAKRLSIDIPKQTSTKDVLKSSLWNVNQLALNFYIENLTGTSYGKKAYEYLLQRGIKPETIKKFQLGYALPGESLLINHLRKKGITLETMEKSGLACTKYGGGYKDLFNNRIIIPFFDTRNRIVAFGARTLTDNNNSPKYINSPENAIFSKRFHLFGLNLAKDEIVKNNLCIVTEGYLDVIIPYQEEVKNTVASSGTSLTEEQIKLIKRYTDNIVLIYDSDNAGTKASLRAIDLILTTGINLTLVNLPQGEDPASYTLKYKREKLLDLIENASDFFDYKLSVLRNIYNQNDISQKQKLAKEMMTTIQKIPSKIVKHEYLKKLSEVLNINQQIIFSEFNDLEKDPVYTYNNEPAYIPLEMPLNEKYIFQCMFYDENIFETLKNKLKLEDLSSTISQKILNKIQEFSLENQQFNIKKFILYLEDKEIIDKITELTLDDFVIDETVLKESLNKIEQKRLKSLREEIKRKIDKAEKENDSQLVHKLIGQYQELIKKTK